MTRDEIKEQLELQSKAIRDIIDLGTVWCDTAFYAYMNAAEYAILMAMTRIGNVNEEDDNGDTEVHTTKA